MTHPDTGHTLMQRATDIQFLRQLARRNGKLCRVACTDTPGQPTGYFITPDVTADPAVTIIATGGLAPLVIDEVGLIDAYEPWLTLIGLRLVFERNVPGD